MVQYAHNILQKGLADKTRQNTQQGIQLRQKTAKGAVYGKQTSERIQETAFI